MWYFARICVRARAKLAWVREISFHALSLISLLHVDTYEKHKISDFQFYQIQNNLDTWHYVWFTLCGASRDQVCIDYASLPFI